MKLLIVEDDRTIALGLSALLKKEGFEPVCCTGVRQGKDAFCPETGLVLLDLNLPDGTGYELCSWIKSVRDVPIIFLTVRDDESDIIRGLDLGADDYVVKPFGREVLLSRIRAVLRRSGCKPPQTQLQCAGVELNTLRASVTVGGEPIRLSAGEYRLLRMMLENKGQIITRGQLLEKLWDSGGDFVEDNALSVMMKRMREKLGGGDFIKTVRGIGYRAEDCSEG